MWPAPTQRGPGVEDRIRKIMYAAIGERDARVFRFHTYSEIAQIWELNALYTVVSQNQYL